MLAWLAFASIMHAYRHLKVIGLAGVPTLAQGAGVLGETGVVEFGKKSSLNEFLELAAQGRVWEREL